MNIKKWLQEIIYRKYYAYSTPRISKTLDSAINKLLISKKFIQKDSVAIQEKIEILEAKNMALSDQHKKISSLLIKIENILN